VALLSSSYVNLSSSGTITAASDATTYWYELAYGDSVAPTKKAKTVAPDAVPENEAAWLRRRVNEICWKAA
jgi:hypothetical protein